MASGETAAKRGISEDAGLGDGGEITHEAASRSGAASIVPYEGVLPYIEDQDAYSPPASYLQKDASERPGYRIFPWPRPSTMLVVNTLRACVAGWRDGGYPGASETTKLLLAYWFEEDHASGFRYYFCQREAIETLIYLAEVRGVLDAGELIERFGSDVGGSWAATRAAHTNEGGARRVQASMLAPEKPEIYTTVAGTRRVRRAFIEDGVQQEGDQDLPPEGLPRYAFKMATGSGKTVVMAMAVVWSYLNKRIDPKCALSTNFLILAPNRIVYERLEKDFASNRIFSELPLIPARLKDAFQLKPMMRGDQTIFSSNGNLILTNVQQLRDDAAQESPSSNPVQELLGRKPVKDALAYGPSVLDRLKLLPDLVSINDEAHHLHDEKLVWPQRLLSLHEALKPAGLSLWLEFSATPKDQNGNYFPWIIVDYPLAQAVEDGIVKAPVLVHREHRPEPIIITVDDFAESYSPWLLAALDRLRRHEDAYKPFHIRPVLFIMTERNNLADRLKGWLLGHSESGLTDDEVLLIHPDTEGDVKEADLPELRKLARSVDDPDSRVRVVVSVLMLKEGWDVRNVTIVLGLRPFSAKAGILPEQAIGRGLRLIRDIGPAVQTLEVMGSARFEEVVRALDTEGVPLINAGALAPPPPIVIEPVREKLASDIFIPSTSPRLKPVYRKLDELDVMTLQPIWDQPELPEPIRIQLMAEFWSTGTQVGLPAADAGLPPLPNDLTTGITKEVERRAAVPGHFSELYPKVRDYLTLRSLGQPVSLDDPAIRNRLRSFDIREAIVAYLTRAIGELTLEKQDIRLQGSGYALSKIKPFTWRRKHTWCDHTIFNYVAAYNQLAKSTSPILRTARPTSFALRQWG